MNIEEIVRTSMDQLARDIQHTVPDPAAVRARVNRSRRFRTITAVGLAAAVAAGTVVGVAELRDRSSGSGPTHPVNSDDSGVTVNVNAVWMIDGVLHIGDQEFLQDKKIDTALVPVESGAVYGARGGGIIYQPVDGLAQVIRTDGQAQPLGGPAPLGPAADPESGIVAVLRWSQPDGRYDAYLYDATRGRQLGTGLPVTDLTLTGDNNPFGDGQVTPIEWIGANDDGGYTMLIRAGRDLWRYDAKGDGSGSLQPVGLAPYDVTLDVVAVAGVDGQMTFTTLGGKALSSVDTVEPDGGLSHDGVYFAGFSTDPEHPGAIAIVETHAGETRYIDPPSGTVATFPSWSSEHTLMFRATDVASPPSGFVVACDADTLACENVAEVDDINKTVLPRL